MTINLIFFIIASLKLDFQLYISHLLFFYNITL